MELVKEKTEKTAIQKSISELRNFLPKSLAENLAQRFDVTTEYVRIVWQGRRENVEIIDATLEEIKTAKKKKAEFDKKLSAVISWKF